MLCPPLCMCDSDLISIPDVQSVTNCKPLFLKKQFPKLNDLLVKILEYTIDLDFSAYLIPNSIFVTI